MRISIFGLGYVGSVSAACLANDGHQVIGVDPDRHKTAAIAEGRAPIIEPGLADMISDRVAGGDLKVTQDAADAVARTDVSIICVGTPSRRDGSLDTIYLERVAADIGRALATGDGFHVVIVRSTSLPGTTEDLVVPLLEQHSGHAVGERFGVAFNPEFLREGSAVDDFAHPPKTVIGATDDRTCQAVVDLFRHLDAPMLTTSIRAAEMVKYADNAWHAVKISFANEVGNIAQAAGLDGRVVMDIFCHDTKLNISTKYLRPGQAFGGSCLPKDLRALNHYARVRSLDVPLMSSVLVSNRAQIDKAIELVLREDCRRVGVLGVSFKAGTDDLRESPAVELVEQLLGKGYDLKIYDSSVEMARLMGANRDFVSDRVPHFGDLVTTSIEEVIDHSEVTVIGTDDPRVADAVRGMSDDQRIIDLVGIAGVEPSPTHHGICW